MLGDIGLRAGRLAASADGDLVVHFVVLETVAAEIGAAQMSGGEQWQRLGVAVDPERAAKDRSGCRFTPTRSSTATPVRRSNA